MKKKSLNILLLITCLLNVNIVVFSQQKAAIEIEFNANLEFIGLASFIGYQGAAIQNNEEIYAAGQQTTQQEWNAFGWQQYQAYQQFAGNPHLAKAFEYAYPLPYDYAIRFIMKLDPFPKASFDPEMSRDDYILFSPNGNEEEARNNATDFIYQLNQFYMAIDFDQYLRKHQFLFDHVRKQLSQAIPDKEFLPGMEEFYQYKFEKYVLIPMMSYPPGAGFAIQSKTPQGEEIYNVFSAQGFQSFDPDQDLDMGFGDPDRIRELSTHEFGHSFVNLHWDLVTPEYVEKTKILLAPIAERMADQGYPEWEYSLGEHIVRAGEVVIAKKLGFQDESGWLLNNYIENRRFIYLPEIIEILEAYDRGEYATYRVAFKKILEMLEKKATQ